MVRDSVDSSVDVLGHMLIEVKTLRSSKGGMAKHRHSSHHQVEKHLLGLMVVVVAVLVIVVIVIAISILILVMVLLRTCMSQKFNVT